MAKKADKAYQYEGPAGGWGSLRSIGKVALREKPQAGTFSTLLHQNKTGGFMCSSCAWAKPAHPHPFEFCENGAKSTIWELTTDRCTPAFFSKHTVTELLEWNDHDLEMQGRLTEPLRYDAGSDRYVACDWNEAFRDIGQRLQAMEPRRTVFYASGKASLEASYLYALFARMYGHNNLPDSSNMCHETTSVGLKKVTGSPVGTCVFEDFEHCDAIFYFGQNPGTCSPRFLHPLQEAAKRGCKIVVFNPIREQGLVRFVNPQNPLQMLSDSPTELAHMYLQLRCGGDIAAILGLCKHILAVDTQRLNDGQPSLLDREFIDRHTRGFEAFAHHASAVPWEDIERESSLDRHDLQAAADIYMRAERVIGVYGMGLTQHVHGSQSIAMLVNLLLLRGNIGRQGAGVSPVRGHSNVQGQRTVGISEKPALVPMDKLEALFAFEPPKEKGMTTVDTCEGVCDGKVRAFIGLGGNFVRAIPDRDRMEPAWRSLDLTVYIATKLNRSHLVHGQASYILPCLARSELDTQASGPQAVSMEDSFSHIYGSMGRRRPASPTLLSEPAIVAGLAKATLPAHPRWKWDDWIADYARIRDLIEQTYPDQFHDFNKRMFQAGGFYRGNPAHEREWKTESGKAEFTTPDVLSALGVGDAPGRFHLITMRSNDQFNTTIYGYDDRLRGLTGSRMILLIHPGDMQQMGLHEGDIVDLVGDAEDGIYRHVDGLTIKPFNIPRGCLGGYYPEMNALVPLWYHDRASKTPAAKGVPVRIRLPANPG
ncbi:MAG TPA: FdhF/YdeP family oxidoreductase [Dyella sp.]|uniref:FdhF/YdeP family oxidoreductase n=1 Tax=Dyella sp. TaxID=1869338 RepID=UPI002F94D497